MRLTKFKRGEQLMWTKISKEIAQATGKHFEIVDRQPISGGSINQAYLISNDRERYFVKLNQPNLVEMFAAEEIGRAHV